MSNAANTLFTNADINGLTLRNRFALAPMTRVSATADGKATEDMKSYYERFAKGGFSLLITEGLYTDKAWSQGYIPQWQGGDNPAYGLGARMLDWLAPESETPVFHVPVAEPNGPLPQEKGMTGRSEINDQLAATWVIIKQQQPAHIVTFGGDCLVSLAPFAWLSEKYGDKLGVLWIDAHPDIQTPAQYPNAHAHVLGALLGNGDADLTRSVARPLDRGKVMIAGIHHPLDHERKFLSEWDIRTSSPEEVKSGGDAVMDWIEANGIEYLAIAEHLPWDAINLKDMLERLPLVGGRA